MTDPLCTIPPRSRCLAHLLQLAAKDRGYIAAGFYHRKKQESMMATRAAHMSLEYWGGHELVRTTAQTVLVAVAALMMVHYLVEPWFRQKSLRTAPGPFPIWPVLGSLPSIGKLPHRTFYHLSKKYGDVMELKLGSTRAVVISSPNFAEEILKTHDQVCASRPDAVFADVVVYGRKDVAFAPYGNHWRHMRKLCVLELLSPKRLGFTKNLRSEEVSFMVKDVYELCKVGLFITHLRPTFQRSSQVSVYVFVSIML
jgi:hypothetical protein